MGDSLGTAYFLLICTYSKSCLKWKSFHSLTFCKRREQISNLIGSPCHLCQGSRPCHSTSFGNLLGIGKWHIVQTSYIFFICFWCRGRRQRYSLNACCPCSWCWSTPHSRWGWHSSSHSGTSGDGSSHWSSTHQSPPRWYNTTAPAKRKFILNGAFL